MGAIRILLALSVVVWHMPGPHLRLLNAAVAVLCFFIVSGFYMALVVNEKYGPSGQGWVRRFYSARFLRLYPAYAAMCMVIVAWCFWRGSPTALTARLPVTGGEQLLLAVLNISVLGQDLYEMMNHVSAGWVRSWFSPTFFNTNFMMIGQAWSLSSEIFFYLLVPFAVRSLPRLVGLFLTSLAIRFFLIGVVGLESGIWGYWFIPATMCMFTLGSLSYQFYRAVKTWRHAPLVGWCALGFMTVWLIWRVMVDGVVLAVDATDNLDQPRFWFAYLTFAAAVPFVFIATKDVRIDRWIGDLSYPLYLCHGMFLGIVFNIWRLPQGTLLSVGIATVASLVAAIMLRWAEIMTDRLLAPAPALQPQT
jgi:peptidoglycan/LPS O-acetylase OafA/YrhL